MKLGMTHTLRMTEIEKGDTILEVGCGTGRFASEFAGLGTNEKSLDL